MKEPEYSYPRNQSRTALTANESQKCCKLETSTEQTQPGHIRRQKRLSEEMLS